MQSENVKLTLGSEIVFGRYMQGGDLDGGKEPIRWRVLKLEGKKALLISTENLDTREYHPEAIEITWETCDLRRWLNDEFLKIAFNASEQNAIALTSLKQETNVIYQTDGGNVTNDKIFLLSLSECEGLLNGRDERISKNSAYARAKGAWTEDNGAGWWWLRTPGSSKRSAVGVRTSGNLLYFGYDVTSLKGAIRPALWLDLPAYQEVLNHGAQAEETPLAKQEPKADAERKIADVEAMKNARNFQDGKEFFASGQFCCALRVFNDLDGYGGSAALAQSAREEMYRKGISLAQEGKFLEAIGFLNGIRDYQDVNALIAGDENLLAAATEMDRRFAVGNTIVFGAYEQDNLPDKGLEPIVWRILANECGNILVISAENLDCKRYHTELMDVTWETCALRGWLNDEFINGAFNEKERGRIALTTVKNAGYSKWGGNGGNDTRDKIFLLSIDEAEKYFSGDDDRIAKNTPYTKSRGAWTNSNNGAGWWWLRSPGSISNGASYVLGNGSLVRGFVHTGGGAVRPAFWLPLTAN